MNAVEPYLFFNGNCREAMNFYAGVFGGKLDMMTYADAPTNVPDGNDRILHARLAEGAFVIMASDPPPNQPVGVGGNFALSLTCKDTEEQDRYFHALSEGGRVTMPLQNTFWGARFAMLFDRFGTQWMLSYPLQQS